MEIMPVKVLEYLDPVTEENIIRAFDESYEEDGESWGKKGNLLFSQYISATEKDRRVIDTVITNLCGYSLKTLVERAISLTEFEV